MLGDPNDSGKGPKGLKYHVVKLPGDSNDKHFMQRNILVVQYTFHTFSGVQYTFHNFPVVLYTFHSFS